MFFKQEEIEKREKKIKSSSRLGYSKKLKKKKKSAINIFLQNSDKKNLKKENKLKIRIDNKRLNFPIITLKSTSSRLKKGKFKFLSPKNLEKKNKQFLKNLKTKKLKKNQNEMNLLNNAKKELKNIFKVIEDPFFVSYKQLKFIFKYFRMYFCNKKLKKTDLKISQFFIDKKAESIFKNEKNSENLISKNKIINYFKKIFESKKSFRDNKRKRNLRSRRVSKKKKKVFSLFKTENTPKTNFQINFDLKKKKNNLKKLIQKKKKKKTFRFSGQKIPQKKN